MLAWEGFFFISNIARHEKTQVSVLKAFGGVSMQKDKNFSTTHLILSHAAAL